MRTIAFRKKLRLAFFFGSEKNEKQKVSAEMT